MPPVIDNLSICARCPYRTYCGQPVPPAPRELEPEIPEEGSSGDEAVLEDLG
jgi:hypothetical protein